MKKSLAVLLILTIGLTGVFAACKKDSGKKEKENGTVASETAAGVHDADTEIDFVEVDVTDKNGEPVTDEDGNKKTEEVPVVITRDKTGKPIAHRIDKEGNTVKETVPYDDPDDPAKDNDKNNDKKNKKNKKKKDSGGNSDDGKDDDGKDDDSQGGGSQDSGDDDKQTPDDPKAGTTDINEYYDSKKGTVVPNTNATGKLVEFSDKDQQRIIHMLEVPYLYKSSYENKNGVPIDIATHAALWMAEKDGLKPGTFASGTIILGLFKYFGQTVVNFKSKCNSDGDNSNIQYNTNGTFAVTSFEEKKQEVKLQKIEHLENGYYKVIGSVTNAEGKSKVVAIIQKNKLDLSLGFSIKALKWS